MEVSYSDLKSKEVVNVYDGKKLGHILDILFDSGTGRVQGLVVPGDKKIFRKSEDVFISLEKIKKIGNDVILVLLQPLNLSRVDMQNSYDRRSFGSDYFDDQKKYEKKDYFAQKYNTQSSFVRYRKVDNKKYK